MSSVFIGLGPRGSAVCEADLRGLLETIAPVKKLTMRGAFAIAEVNGPDDAQALIAGATNQYVGEARLSARLDRNADGGASFTSSRPARSGGQSYSPAGVNGCELFIGLGPNGRCVAEADLRRVLAPYAKVVSVAFTPQGTGAVVRVATDAGAAAAASGLNNSYIGDVRLSIRGNNSQGPRHAARGPNGYPAHGTPMPNRLYIGLGPNGRDVTEADLRAALESVAPISGLRHIGRCAFVDVDGEQAGEALIAALNGTTLGRSRLVVRCSYE